MKISLEITNFFTQNATIFFLKLLFNLYCGNNSIERINYEKFYIKNNLQYTKYYLKINPKYNKNLYLFPFKYEKINFPL